MPKIFLLILIVNIHPTVMHIQNPSDTREPDYTIVRSLVNKLPASPLIFHYDNRIQNGELLSELSNEVRCRYMWNHDMQTSFRRVYDLKHIHIVDLSNFAEIEKRFLKYKFVHPWDIIVFLVRQEPVPEVIVKKLSLVTRIFVVTLADSKLFSCKDAVNCILTETKIEDISFKSVFDVFTMKGMGLRVGYVTNAPYVYQRTNSKGIPKLSGSEISLLKMLSKLKHFRYKLVGIKNNNESKYSAMLENLERGKILLAIGGINQNIDRTRKYEFMRYIRLEGMTAMFYRSEDPHPLLTLSKSPSFQRINLLVLLCMSSVFLMEYFSNKWFGNIQNDKIVYILIIIAPLMEQIYPLRRMFRKKSVKFVLIIWWISGCLISLTYKNYLLASFISSSHKSMTMLDLMRDGYRFKSSEDDYWYIKQSCANSPQCIGVKKRFSFGNLCESSPTMKSEKLALIGEKHALSFKILSGCEKLSSAEKFKVTFTDDNILGAEWQTWAMRKHSMFTLAFSKIVSQMDAAGILEMWSRNEINPKYITRENVGRSTEKVYSPLDLKIVSSPFTLLFVGLLISFLAFLTELLKKKQKMQVLPVTKRLERSFY